MKFIDALLAAGVVVLSADPSIAQVAQRNVASNGGTIATGGTFQQVMNRNDARMGCQIENTSSHTMDVFLGLAASATAATSFTVASGASWFCNTPHVTITSPIAITMSASADAYVWSEE